MANSLKTEMLRLPMCFIGGEQKNDVVIPFDNFVVTSDADFIKQVEADEREEKVIYAYTDSGVSENNRDWSPEVMESIAAQVIEKMPVGYLGHIKPKDYGFEFPEPQIVWFGSYTEALESSTRLWIKGYLLPTAKKLEVWIGAKAVDSISVYGKIAYTMDGEIMKLKSVDLKSIDVARKLGEGLNSGIVGLYGEMSGGQLKEGVGSEMEATYDAIRELLNATIREALKEDPTTFGYTLARPPLGCSPDWSPYTYSWVKDMYVDKPHAIVNVEYADKGKLLDVAYTYDDKNGAISIDSFEEVLEQKSYVKKPGGVSETKPSISGEMTKTIKEQEENNMPEITMADVMANEALANSLRTHFASEMATEQSQKVQIAKAGEMDKILAVVGGEMEGISDRVSAIAKFNAKFVGEMSAIFAGESDEELSPDEIVERTQEAVDTLNNVKAAVGVKDGEDVVEAVKETVEANAEALAVTAISEVDKAFEDKLADLDDEALADFIRDDYADIVGLKPADIDGDVSAWKDAALKEINDNFDSVAKKYADRLAKVGHKQKAVGEMSAMQSMGTFVTTKSNAADTDEDPDIAEAKKLGYGV